MPYYVRETELFHHGIMKQKWGRRNGPPYPLKNAERSSAEKSANKESKSSKEKKSSGSGSGGSGSSSSKKSTKSTEKSSSSSESGSKEKKKSKHRTNLEEKYQTEYGMSKSDAEAAAAKRIRAEKVVAAVAGAAIIGTAAFIAYRKYGKKYVGQTIKKGMTFQRMTANGNGVNTEHALYVANNAKDKVKYKGMYGYQIIARQNAFGQPAQVYKVNLKATDKLKVPSDKTARNVFKDLYNNDTSFKSAWDTQLKDYYENYGFGGKVQDIIEGMSGKVTASNIDTTGYDIFNCALCDHRTSESATVANKFYSKLKSMGYDAIEDINDKKYSGYNAKNPLIVFNGSKLVEESTKEVAGQEIYDALNSAQNMLTQEANLSAFINNNASKIVTSAGVTGVGAGALYIEANSPKKKSA